MGAKGRTSSYQKFRRFERAGTVLHFLFGLELLRVRGDTQNGRAIWVWAATELFSFRGPSALSIGKVSLNPPFQQYSISTRFTPSLPKLVRNSPAMQRLQTLQESPDPYKYTFLNGFGSSYKTSEILNLFKWLLLPITALEMLMYRWIDQSSKANSKKIAAKVAVSLTLGIIKVPLLLASHLTTLFVTGPIDVLAQGIGWCVNKIVSAVKPRGVIIQQGSSLSPLGPLSEICRRHGRQTTTSSLKGESEVVTSSAAAPRRRTRRIRRSDGKGKREKSYGRIHAKLEALERRVEAVEVQQQQEQTGRGKSSRTYDVPSTLSTGRHINLSLFARQAQKAVEDEYSQLGVSKEKISFYERGIKGGIVRVR